MTFDLEIWPDVPIDFTYPLSVLLADQSESSELLIFKCNLEIAFDKNV